MEDPGVDAAERRSALSRPRKSKLASPRSIASPRSGNGAEAPLSVAVPESPSLRGLVEVAGLRPLSRERRRHASAPPPNSLDSHGLVRSRAPTCTGNALEGIHWERTGSPIRHAGPPRNSLDDTSSILVGEHAPLISEGIHWEHTDSPTGPPRNSFEGASYFVREGATQRRAIVTSTPRDGEAFRRRSPARMASLAWQSSQSAAALEAAEARRSSPTPSARSQSPRAPSPRAPSPRAPSPRAPSPRAPSPRAPSPRAPSPRVQSPRATSPLPWDSPRSQSPQARFALDAVHVHGSPMLRRSHHRPQSPPASRHVTNFVGGASMQLAEAPFNAGAEVDCTPRLSPYERGRRQSTATPPKQRGSSPSAPMEHTRSDTSIARTGDRHASPRYSPRRSPTLSTAHMFVGCSPSWSSNFAGGSSMEVTAGLDERRLRRPGSPAKGGNFVGGPGSHDDLKQRIKHHAVEISCSKPYFTGGSSLSLATPTNSARLTRAFSAGAC
jgi:hypothetical protein